MTCASCVATIERALLATPGVTSAVVNLATETAQVHGPQGLSRAALVEAVSKSGYKVKESNASSADETSSGETKDATRRLLVAALLTIPLLVIAMGPHVLMLLGIGGSDSSSGDIGGMDGMAGMEGMEGMPGMGASPSTSTPDPMMNYAWLQFLLATPVVLYSGAPFFTGAWHGFRNRTLSMDTLVATGTATAYGYSAAITLMPTWAPAPGLYFETAAVIVTLVLLGRRIERRARKKARATVRQLMEFGAAPPPMPTEGAGAPNVPPPLSTTRSDPTSTMYSAPSAQSLPVAEVAQGTPTPYTYASAPAAPQVQVVASAAASNPEDLLPPVVAKEIAQGDVGNNWHGTLAGQTDRPATTPVETGPLYVSPTLAAAPAREVRRIVEEAQASRVPIQRAVDRVVRYFVPAVLLVAIASFTYWLTLGAPVAMAAGYAPSTVALLSLITVLIIACPCALGLATPMAVLVGTGRGAQHGLIIKGGEGLEASRSIDTVVLERSGVVTTGKPEVTDVVPLRISEDELLALAGAVEAKSAHPLGIAIHRRAQVASAMFPPMSSFQSVAGRGVTANVGEKAVGIGQPEWLLEQGIALAGAEADIARLRAQAKTVIAVAQDGLLLGMFATTDPIKSTSRAGIALLQEHGIDVALLTGDHATTANAVAESLGIKRVIANVAPADKAAAIRRLKGEGRRVAVVGNGFTDAPVLAEANLGIAMGAGLDVANEAGGIILVKDDLSGVVAALDLARQTRRKIHQNLTWAFGYNAILIPVAAGLLVAWPIFGRPILLDPMLGAVAMTLSILSVVVNSLRLRNWQPAHSSSSRLMGAARPVAKGIDA